MNNKSKTFMIFSVLTLIIVVIVSSTYAWYVWTTDEDDTIKIVTGVGGAKVTFEGGSNISANLRPVSDKTKGIVKNISIKADTSNLTFNLYLDINSIDEDLKHSSFKYALYNGEEEKISGNFSSYTTEECTKNNTNHIVLLKEESISTTKTTYTLYIWIDGTEGENPSTMMNKTFSFNLHADGQDAILNEDTNSNTLATYITNLYTNADKTEVTNNSITYNYATSVSLMNDRLGGTTEDYDAGNIRYYGASPNNYIYFNCSDYSNQTSDTCELWRIIGVFNGKVKLIRNENIGALDWDYDKNIDNSLTTYDNDWSTSSLQILLNEKYYYGDTAGIVTYYSGSMGDNPPYESTLNMTSIGIKNNLTRNMITNETYYLRGTYKASDFPNNIYNYERTTGNVNTRYSTSWIGKVALTYVSDYGYTVDFTQCNLGLWYYEAFEEEYHCESTNWLSKVITDNGNLSGWLLNSDSREDVSLDEIFCIYDDGGLHSEGVNTCGYAGVNPVLHLNSDVEVSNVGDGTSDNPYRINI